MKGFEMRGFQMTRLEGGYEIEEEIYILEHHK